jgi:hypothetical protein
MSLLKDYENKGAEPLKDFTKGVITGLSSDPIFDPLRDDVTELVTLNTALASSILPFTERTSHTDDVMMDNKSAVIGKLDFIRKKADEICNGDENKERLSGFTPSKKTRTTRKFIDPAHIMSAVPTGIKGQILFTLQATVPGNTGYEVHYILDGVDYIVGVSKVKSRQLTMLVSNFPSLKPMEVYLLTLSTNNLRSTKSNSITVAAS